MGIFNWVVEAAKNPKELSTVFPSSRFLAGTIADQIDYSAPRLIAELGPADGALTRPIVDRMDPDSRLLLIEVVEAFCQDLREEYEGHAKRDAMEIINGDAGKLDSICKDRDIDAFDYVVSGLPLTTLPDELSQRVLKKTHETLKPGGKYIQFQYSQDYKEDIEEIFGPVELHRVWLNILPAWVYVATKDGATGQTKES